MVALATFARTSTIIDDLLGNDKYRRQSRTPNRWSTERLDIVLLIEKALIISENAELDEYPSLNK
jgi:hypothetical protein